jgi:hypothetical protein
MTPLTLHPVNASVCQVRDAQGQLVGSLKLIGNCWKFKAIGNGPGGELIPGGGPLTHRHNTVFETLDAEAVNAGLFGGGGD